MKKLADIGCRALQIANPIIGAPLANKTFYNCALHKTQVNKYQISIYYSNIKILMKIQINQKFVATLLV